MSAPIVVHFIETDIAGGAESMLLDLCRRQQAAGLRPMIAHFDHPYFARHCSDLKIDTFELPGRARFKKMATLPWFAFKFARRLRQRRVALLHSHLFGPIVGGSVAAFLARIPHVGTLHDIHMIEDAPARIRQLQGALWLGTRLIAVSRQMQGFYRQRLKWRNERIGYIHNGIEPTGEIVAIGKESLGVSLHDPVAIAVGRLVPLKRLQDALQALAIVLKSQPMTLLVVGTGPEQASLQALARQLNIAEQVKFLGERRDVPALLRSADLFIQCSQTEGLSMSVIEALHAALPCIVTAVGGNPELVSHEINGALVEVGDCESLAAWMKILAQDEARRIAMGRHSREIALREFSGRVCADHYLSCYRALLGR